MTTLRRSLWVGLGCAAAAGLSEMALLTWVTAPDLAGTLLQAVLQPAVVLLPAIVWGGASVHPLRWPLALAIGVAAQLGLALASPRALDWGGVALGAAYLAAVALLGTAIGVGLRRLSRAFAR